MCARCCAPRATGTRASVRNVVPLLVTVTSAHAAQYRRCIILCARRCTQTHRLPRVQNARASSEYIHCATCRIYSYYTCRLGVCASPRELEISPLRRRRRLSQHSRLLRAHVRENAPERKRATPRFRSPLEPIPRGRENRSRSRANACNRTVSSHPGARSQSGIPGAATVE